MQRVRDDVVVCRYVGMWACGWVRCGVVVCVWVPGGLELRNAWKPGEKQCRGCKFFLKKCDALRVVRDVLADETVPTLVIPVVGTLPELLGRPDLRVVSFGHGGRFQSTTEWSGRQDVV